MINLHRLQSLYNQGKNITELLRAEQGLHHNTCEIIEAAYDLQAGSYIAEMKNRDTQAYKRRYTAEIVKTILSLCKPASILEAGVGEATTFSGVLQGLKYDVRSFGFDLSWSRVAYANRWLRSKRIFNAILCTGSLLNIPFADNSVDIVYTSHSIEPNGGNERPILQELFRVTRKFLILLEPCYELASREAKERMDAHGYCKNLMSVAQSLGYNILKYGIFPFFANPLNPTAITIIGKYSDAPPPSYTIACPQFKTPLEKIGNALFSQEALKIYPIIASIPCLRIENGIFASKYKEIVETV